MSARPDIDRDAVRRRAVDGAPLLVLLHGYGSDENDLFGLVPYLPDDLGIASLPAPHAAPWPSPGRSWYPIDELERGDASAATASAEAVLRWLDENAGDAPAIALLGFSQGASIALQALRLASSRIDAVVNLSGFVVPGDLPQDAELRARRTPAFWGRGTRDDVIREELIALTAQWMPDHTELSGRVYPGLTHSVSEEELADVRTFLERWRERCGAGAGAGAGADEDRAGDGEDRAGDGQAPGSDGG